jgi:hypothetical protein
VALQRRWLQRVDRRLVPFHAQRHVNSTGLVAVVDLPQLKVLLVMDGVVVVAAVIIAVVTRGRLGLK